MRRAATPRVFLKLDGSNDSVVAPSYTVPTAEFGMAIWYKPANRTANTRLIDYQAAGPDGGFTLIHSSTTPSQVAFRVNNGGTGTVDILSKNLIYGEWNLIVANFATNSAEYFVNNVSQGTDTSCAMSTPAATVINIGKRTTGATNFAKGQVRDFIIMPRKFTSAERDSLYADKVPQVVIDDADIYWPLNELSGATAVDASGNGKDGTINGSALFATDGGRGIQTTHTKALNYARKTTAITSFADAAPLRIETNNTFSWFARVHLLNTNENVLMRIAEKAPHFWCIMSDQTVTSTANCLALEIADASDINDTTEYWSTTALQPHRTYAVGVSHEDGVVKHYIDGELDGLNTIVPGGSDGYTTDMQDTITDPLVIGNRVAGSRNWGGMIWDFQQFSVALTPTEFKQLAQGTAVTRGLVLKVPFSEGTGAEATDTVASRVGAITAATWQTLANTRSAASNRGAASNRTTP